MTVFRRLVLMGLAVGFSALVQGQSSLSHQGGEAPFSGATRGDQAWPSLALSDAGGLAAWQDNTLAGANGGWGVAARYLDADGLPQGPSFRVNAGTAGSHERPQVALLNNGGAAFVWQGGRVGFQNVHARFQRSDGQFDTGDVLVSRPLFAVTNRTTVTWRVIRNNRPALRRFRVFQVIEHRRDFSVAPVVASLSGGDVAVAYSSYVRHTTNSPFLAPQTRFFGTAPVTNSIVVPFAQALDNMQDIYVRRFTPSGQLLGDEFRANQVTLFNQRNPALAALGNGNFVVVWVSENQGLTLQQVNSGLHRLDLYARLFNAGGIALGNEFRLNDVAATENGSPSVAALAGGGFRVAWAQRTGVADDGWDIVTRSFDAGGAAASATERVNTFTYGDQFAPKIASCPGGELIVWTSLAQDGSNEGVYGQWLSGGAPSGGEFLVNTTTAGRQFQPAVAASRGNRVMAGWAGLSLGHGFDVFSQSYSASNP